MTGCYHPTPDLAYAAGQLACYGCGAVRELTKAETERAAAAVKAFVRFAEQHDAPLDAENRLLLRGEGVGYVGRTPDGREFGIGFLFDRGEPFPRPAPYWPSDVRVPLRQVRA